jgi:hypothetical protein
MIVEYLDGDCLPAGRQASPRFVGLAMTAEVFRRMIVE